jgi:preprotein translocase subunit SecD
MRALATAWICGLVVACSGHAERGQPAADESGARTPPGRRLQLVYDLDLDRAVDDRASVIRSDLEAALAEQTIVATVTVSAASPGALIVTPRDGASTLAIEQLVKASYSDTVDRRPCEPSAGPSAICLQISASVADAIRKAALRRAISTIRARLVEAKVADPTVLERAGQIVVEVPADPQGPGPAIRPLIATTGKLELKVVDDGSAYMKRLLAHVGGAGANRGATDARAIEEAITAEVDQWRTDDG